MRKALIFISIVLVLILLYGGYVMYVSLSRDENAPANNVVDTLVDSMFRTDRTPTPVDDSNSPFGDGGTPRENGSTGPVVSDVVELPGRDDKPVRVNAFLSPGATTSTSTSAMGLPPNSDVDITPDAAPDTYQLLYIASDQSFTVSLLAEPLGEARKEAEKTLQAILGISLVDMCRIRHVVLTPGWVSDFYSGRNLGFSFCPGSVKF